MLIFTGSILPSKLRRIFSNTHNLPGVDGEGWEEPVDPQSHLGYPFRLLLGLEQV